MGVVRELNSLNKSKRVQNILVLRNLLLDEFEYEMSECRRNKDLTSFVYWNNLHDKIRIRFCFKSISEVLIEKSYWNEKDLMKYKKVWL